MSAARREGQMDTPPLDESLRALLVELRRARLIEIDAINLFLGNPPREPRPRREPVTRVWRGEDEEAARQTA